MARALIELVGDYVSAHLALTKTEADLASLAGTADTTATSVGTATSSMTVDMDKLMIKAGESAKTQIASSERIVAGLQAQMAAYKELYATASASQQGILAESFAAKSKRVSRLTGAEALGITGIPLAAGGSSVAAADAAALERRRVDEQKLSQTLRGAAKGAGGLGGLGFAALAGTSFIGAYAGAAALKSLVTAAMNAQAQEKLLAQATKTAGETFSAWQPVLDKHVETMSNATGFTTDEIRGGLIPLIRATGSVTDAMKLSGLAADIARGRNIDYGTASLLVSKVVNGNVGLFKRYGVAVQAGATPLQALAAAQQKYAGAANAYAHTAAGSFARFHAAIHTAEEQIGKALLPEMAHLTTRTANWITQMEKSGKLAADVHKVGRALHGVGTILGLLITDFKQLIHLGGDLAHVLDTIKMPSILGISPKTYHGQPGGFFDVGAALKTALKVLVAPGYGLHQLLSVGPQGGGDATAAAIRQQNMAWARYQAAQRRQENRDRSPIGTPTGTLDQFKLTNLSQKIQQQLARAHTDQQKLLADLTAATAIEKLLHTKGALSAMARVEAEKILGRLDAQILVLKKKQIADISKDHLYTQARLDLSLGETKLAEQLLRQDKRRLEEMLKQAKAGAERDAIEKQLTKVVTALTHATKPTATSVATTLGTGAKDQLLAKAKLDLARGDYLAADRLLRTDKARLEQELRQATNADQRLAILKQLTTVEKELKAKDASFQVSMKLQVAQAKADAMAALSGGLTQQQIHLAEELKKAAMKAINSHKLTMQGLIDAWNAVAQANSVLAQAQGMVNTYHTVSTKALVQGLGLTQAQINAIRERGAQAAAHRGRAPSGPAILGQPTTDQHHHRRHHQPAPPPSRHPAGYAPRSNQQDLAQIQVTIKSDVDAMITKIERRLRQTHNRAGSRR